MVYGDWTCGSCNFRIFSGKDHCCKCSNCLGVCNRQHGDWNCPSCGYHLFASKKYCYKCKVDRNGNRMVSEQRVGDWFCPGCNDLIFARKDRCFRCNITKPIPQAVIPLSPPPLEINSETNEQINDNDNLCIICYANPKNSVFLHGESAHQAACFSCAQQCFNQFSNGCPICRSTIERVVRLF